MAPFGRIRVRGLALCASLVVGLTSQATATVVISELMYHSPHGRDYDYVELQNSDVSSVDISNWYFAGLTFTFPPGSTIPGGGYVVVCANETAFSIAYPTVPAAAIFGDFLGSLETGGERRRKQPGT